MFTSAIYVLLATAFVGFGRWSQAQDLMCCLHATGSCKTVCEQISLVDIAANPKQRDAVVSKAQKFCSHQLVSFWSCLNATFEDISRGDLWPGRVCCPLPLSENCRRSCVTATTVHDLTQNCRRSDEIAFYSCLDRQQTGEECCGNAKTEECKSACVEVFRSSYTPDRHQRRFVLDQCSSSHKVLTCVKEIVDVTPVTDLRRYIQCCEKSEKYDCQTTCRDYLSRTNTSLQEASDGISKACGLPLLQDAMWQCFMQVDTGSASVEISTIRKVGMDSAKWHCCQRASTTRCKKLCTEIYTKDWYSSKEFQTKCLNEGSHQELKNCIEEVDEPCELGCEGLSFCTNFNNRPTELFRSCTTQADDAARNDVFQWQRLGVLGLPGLNLPLINTTRCSSDIWKAVACTLQIKPCSRQSHGNQICRDACMDILTECVDWEKVDLQYTVESICRSISPDDVDSSCISLEHFLSPPDNNYQRIDRQVSSPCKGDPCKSDEICTVNKNCNYGMNCMPYICTPGCKLGEVSEYTVPEGAYVRIPIPKNEKGCLKICRCSGGQIVDCHPLLCVTLSPCWIGGTERPHLSQFNLDCNAYACYAGEIISTKRQCDSRISGYTSLPCNCPQHFVPVCGRNGNLYQSFCLARCAGLSDADLEYEMCHDPCKQNPCAIGQKCVVNHQVCLSLKQNPCLQYECINGTANCANQPTDPVCDVDNNEYANSCLLAHHNAKLAYRGPCLRNCKHTGSVCGVNGKTYSSECAAFADYVSVDYHKPCEAVGLIAKSEPCPGVVCPPLPHPNCIGTIPPGACCPTCGGALRLLYSLKQIDRALYVFQQRRGENIGSTHPLTLRALLRALDRLVQVAQCTVRGHLTIERDLFVLVQSTEYRPADVQLEACVREAEKIASLVNRQSPRVVSELSLSSLVRATVVHRNESGRAHQGGRGLGVIWLIFAVVLRVTVF